MVVGQFMKGQSETLVGDPSFTLVLPTERFRCGGRFYSFLDFNQDLLGNGSYVNIVAPTSDIDDIELDGDLLSNATTCGGYNPIAFGSTGYSWTKCQLADPTSGTEQHILDSGSTPIGVYVYGQNDFWGAYAYVAGMGF